MNKENNKKKSNFIIIIIILAVIIGAITAIAIATSKSDNDESPTDVPVLSLSQQKISVDSEEFKSGVIPIEMEITGYTGGWANIGIHIAYDNRLTVDTLENGNVAFDRGNASEYIPMMLAVNWETNLSQFLEENNYYSVFICSTNTENTGLDGTIATFYFNLPDDAKVGDVYDLEYFYYEATNEEGKVIAKDAFSAVETDETLQQYVFDNWENGYIEII